MSKQQRFQDALDTDLPNDVFPPPRIIDIPTRQLSSGDHLGYNTTLNQTGLVIPSGLTLEQWQTLGKKIGQEIDKFQWVIGDWLVYAERYWGMEDIDGKKTTKIYDIAEHITGYSRRSLWRFKSVADFFDGVNFLRRKSVGYSLHAIAFEELPTDARDSLINAMLEDAEKEQWKVSTLRDAIAEVKEHINNLPATTDETVSSRLPSARTRFRKHLTPQQFNKMSTDEQVAFWQWWQEQTEKIRRWMDSE